MLPLLLRFRDLRTAQIVKSWQQLKEMVEKQGFPEGIKLGPSTRVWTEDEVLAWLSTRPKGSVKLRPLAGLAAARAKVAQEKREAEITGAFETMEAK
ncbi:MAG: hypothetical protein WA441_07990 [Methyloceanibacter sp.]